MDSLPTSYITREQHNNQMDQEALALAERIRLITDCETENIERKQDSINAAVSDYVCSVRILLDL